MIEKSHYKNKVTLSLNLVFIVFSISFLIDSGLHRICIYLATLLWLIEGDFKRKILQIYEQKIILFYSGILICLLISLFFLSDSIENGYWYSKYESGYEFIFKKPFIYFLMGVYISTSLKKNFTKYILISFFIQIIFLLIYSSLGYSGSELGFHSISYSLTLIIGLAVSFYYILKFKNLYIRLIFLGIILLLISNIFMFSSRNSYLNLSIILLIIIGIYFINFKKINYLKVLLSGSLIIILMLTLTYNTNDKFNSRINQTIINIENYGQGNFDYSTSIGTRLGMYEVGINLLLKDNINIFFGLGMGDTKKKIETYILENKPQIKSILDHPHLHNQFIQLYLEGGVIALIIFILMLYKLFQLKLQYKDKILIRLIVITFVIFCLSDNFMHNVKIMGIFSFFIGYFLAINSNIDKNDTFVTQKYDKISK